MVWGGGGGGGGVGGGVGCVGGGWGRLEVLGQALFYRHPSFALSRV